MEALAGGDTSAERFRVSRKITRTALFLCSGRTVCRGRRDAHDCRDAGGRAMQEQLPRSGAKPTNLARHIKALPTTIAKQHADFGKIRIQLCHIEILN